MSKNDKTNNHNPNDKLNIGINIFNSPKGGLNKLGGNGIKKFDKNINGLRPDNNLAKNKGNEKEENDQEDYEDDEYEEEYENDYDDENESNDENYNDNEDNEDEDYELENEDENENEPNSNGSNESVLNKMPNKYFGRPLAKDNIVDKTNNGNFINSKKLNSNIFNRPNNLPNSNLDHELKEKIKNNLIKLPDTSNDLFYNFKDFKEANLQKILSQSPYLLINLPFLNKATKLINQGNNLETKNKIAAHFLANDVLVTLLINYKILFKKLDHHSLPAM